MSVVNLELDTGDVTLFEDTAEETGLPCFDLSPKSQRKKNSESLPPLTNFSNQTPSQNSFDPMMTASKKNPWKEVKA